MPRSSQADQDPLSSGSGRQKPRWAVREIPLGDLGGVTEDNRVLVHGGGGGVGHVGIQGLVATR
jgi:hypothetical protein